LDAGPIAAAAKNADFVVFALAVRARSGSGSIAVPEVARKLLAETQAPVIAIAFGTPYLLREIPAAGTYLCAYGPQPVMQLAAVHALFGETPVSGKLPITIPGLALRGTGIAKP
jgi:beta-N-acetylhexosaminidase